MSKNVELIILHVEPHRVIIKNCWNACLKHTIIPTENIVKFPSMKREDYVKTDENYGYLCSLCVLWFA